jgi:AbrB family looped-hinge helix DNA binding protein
MVTTIDAAGRLVIPRTLRDRAGLKAGMELSLEYRDGRIEVEPVRRHARMVRRGSRYVLSAPPGTPPLTQEQANRILEEVRDERFTTSAFPRR